MMSAAQVAVAARPRGRYHQSRCGQAGQLVRGPHAPPAAATFRMGMRGVGARTMNDGAREPYGLTPDVDLGVPFELAADTFAPDAEVFLAAFIGNLIREGTERSQAVRRAKHLRVRYFLCTGKLIASAMQYGTGDLRRFDLPAEIWPSPGYRVPAANTGSELVVRVGGTLWFSLFVREANRTVDWKISTSAGAISGHSFSGGGGENALGAASPLEIDAPVVEVLSGEIYQDSHRTLQGQQYREHAEAIWNEVLTTKRPYSGVVNAWIAAGKHKEIVKSGRAGGVEREAYKKAIDKETEALGRPVKKRRERRTP